MQPVYGVIYGVIFLHSIPDTATFIGGAIIVTAAVYESLREHNKAALALTD
jgi:drug/metabolite transporter (DMT)-like permease